VSDFRTVISRSFRNGWLNAVHDDDKAAIINGWQNETTINKLMSEYRFMRPDGKIAWVMGQSIPEVNSENQIVCRYRYRYYRA
jgi:hypothetical protein